MGPGLSCGQWCKAVTQGKLGFKPAGLHRTTTAGRVFLLGESRIHGWDLTEWTAFRGIKLKET